MICSRKSERSVRSMLCAEWQSAQTGSSLRVWVTSGLWTLAVNSSKMPRWHCAQVRAMLARLTLERGSLAVDARARVARGQFVMRGMAVGAICGHRQPAFDQPLSVNALQVMFDHVVLRPVVAQRGLLPRPVALSAQRRHVARKRRRGRVFLS